MIGAKLQDGINIVTEGIGRLFDAG